MNAHSESINGQWFHRRQGWWVYPTAIEKEVQDSIERGVINYDKQPSWTFAMLGSKSNDDLEEMLKEFSRNSHEASQLFDWSRNYPLHLPASPYSWKIKQHGWKHVSFQDFREKAREVREMDGKSFIRRTVFAVGHFKDFENLVNQARERNPAAVSRIWYLCRNGEHLRAALSFVYDRFENPKSPAQIEALMQQIPNPLELGTAYLERIFADPGLDPGNASLERQRELLNDLVSPGRIKGGGPDGGHPSCPYNWAEVVFVRAMAFSLLNQIGLVRKFIKKARGFENGLARMSCKYLSIDDSDFAEKVKDVGISSRALGHLANVITADELSTASVTVSPAYVKKKWNDSTKSAPGPEPLT